MICECPLIGGNANELFAVHENELEIPIKRSAGDWRRFPEIGGKRRVGKNRFEKTQKCPIVLPPSHDVRPGERFVIKEQLIPQNTALMQLLDFAAVHARYTSLASRLPRNQTSTTSTPKPV